MKLSIKQSLIVFIGIVLLAFFISCNDGQDAFVDPNGCITYKWSSLSTDQKEALMNNGIDTTKCYKIEP